MPMPFMPFMPHRRPYTMFAPPCPCTPPGPPPEPHTPRPRTAPWGAVSVADALRGISSHLAELDETLAGMPKVITVNGAPLEPVEGVVALSLVDSAVLDGGYLRFKAGDAVLFSIDASPFVKDGMVDAVGVADGNLVVTFNTDSGKQPVSIPLTEIFDPDDYYDKAAVDGLLSGKRDKTDLSVDQGKWLLVKPDGTLVWMVSRGDPDDWVGDDELEPHLNRGSGPLGEAWVFEIGPQASGERARLEIPYSEVPIDSAVVVFNLETSTYFDGVYRLVRGSRFALDTEIPPAQVNADWNAVSGPARILNKPTIPTVPTPVAPSTAPSAAGKPADAKATGDALANRRSVSNFLVNGWVLKEPGGDTVALGYISEDNLWDGGGYDLSFHNGTWSLSNAQSSWYVSAPEDASALSFTAGTSVYSLVRASRLAFDVDVFGKQDRLTFETSVTRNSDNPVKSSGIWSAIWGALSALPTGFMSLYDWCVAQLAGKLDKSGDQTLNGNLIVHTSISDIAVYGGTSIQHLSSGTTKQFMFPAKSGTFALTAGTGHAGNLAALNANGNPTDSGIAAGDLITIVTLADSTETMASIFARLNAINAAHKHVFFDCSGIDVNPRLYLCTIMIDADANAVRVYDQVTGKLYIGPYDAAETIGEVFAKAVDAYHSITVSAVTLDGVTVTGQTVTIREGTDATAPVYATATITDGAPVVFVVPKGMIYFLEITDALADHFGPRVTSGAKQGIVTADAAVTFTYYDAEHIDVSEITTFAKLQEALTWFGTNEAAARNNLVGIEIADTWTATNGTVYDNPRVVWDVHYFEDENGVSHLGALMGTKYCSHNDVQFDAAEGVECDSSTETVAEAGVYYYGLASGETSKTATNLTLLELSIGDTLPYADYAKIYKSAIRDTSRNSLQYGYNNWRDSAYRQYLNSDAATGQWWGATHIGDVAPLQLNSVRGFMAGCSAALLAAAKKVKVATWPNSVTDGPNQITTLYETLDTFFLPSGSEVYGDVNRNGGASVEGELSLYWQARTGYTAPNNAAKATRIIYRELPVGSTASRSAASVRLRSAYRGISNYVWFVNTSGQVNYYSNSNAHGAYASVPACVIY